MNYDLTQKPDPNVCPRQFCFMWQLQIPITSAMQQPPTVAQGCRNPFSVCTRLDPEHGKRDMYEDHGPNLEEAGLPWFYFYPTPEKLVQTSRQKYIDESEPLWGKEHWLQK